MDPWSETWAMLCHRIGMNTGLLGSLSHLVDKLFAQDRNTNLSGPGCMFL